MDDLAKQIADKVIAYTQYFSAALGFVGVLIGAATTILGNLILHRLGAKKERRQEVLKRELDRLYKLEEMAGEITEWAGSYQLDHSSEELRNRFNGFKVAAGTFRKYPNLKQAIRDLNQYAMILVSEKNDHRDDRKCREELEVKYKAFIQELENVLKCIKT
ncbi:MAG TPA: hypothetical protein ACFYD7_13670 [Candidatus Wujingus californicus]|uniref:hypothetical protein n=1 Tax=Candidatus Wujingus californicus TaxID=3367618 RepID=UPI004028D559